MNRIDERFERLRTEGKKGFVAYIGAGDPNLEVTEHLAVAFNRTGVDVLELGVPFSDPLADGLVNQLAAQRGLESGTTVDGLFESIRRIREQASIPIVLYVYFNLLHQRGVGRFIQQAVEAGVDGLLALDLPPEEAEEYEAFMAEAGVRSIYLVAPTTPEDRVERIVSRASGFVYYISREGVTGMQKTISASIGQMTQLIRRYTQAPIAVGFGVSNPEQAQAVARLADAVVVGSAIVNQIAEHLQDPTLVEHVSGFVADMVSAVKQIDSRD